MSAVISAFAVMGYPNKLGLTAHLFPEVGIDSITIMR